MQRAATEDLSENWLEAPADAPSPWRIMHANDPAFAIAVAVWIDGKSVRPGLAMRVRMAMNSLLGSAHAPIIMTVTPAVNWETLDPAGRRKADASLSAFLASQPDLVQTVGTLSAM